MVRHSTLAGALERSKERLADLALGCSATDPDVRAGWIEKVRDRVAFLEEESRTYGLLPHEEDELEALQGLAAGHAETIVDVTPLGDGKIAA